jgi:hypothetical protein
MLFLAVTLGFIVENQREHYTEKKRAKEYAVSLLMDLKEDSANIYGIIQSRTLRKQRLSSLMDELEKKPTDQQDNVIFLVGVEELSRRAYPTFRIGTYEQIKNSGSLRYFTNKTSAALVEYESYRTVLDKQLEIENKYVLENIIPLREKFINPKYLRDEIEEDIYYYRSFDQQRSCHSVRSIPINKFFAGKKSELYNRIKYDCGNCDYISYS